MMSLETIRFINSQIAFDAAVNARKPFVPENGDELRRVLRGNKTRIPNLGSYCPTGWERVDGEDALWFVDKTGLGKRSEPALTVADFINLAADYVDANPGVGIAVCEEGPFQVYVGAYRRVKN